MPFAPNLEKQEYHGTIRFGRILSNIVVGEMEAQKEEKPPAVGSSYS